VNPAPEELLAGRGSEPSDALAAAPESVIMMAPSEECWGKKSIGLSGEGAGARGAYGKRDSLARTGVGRRSTTVRCSVSVTVVSSTGGFARGKEKDGGRKGKKNARKTKRKDMFRDHREISPPGWTKTERNN